MQKGESRQGELEGDCSINYTERTQWEMRTSDFHDHYEIFLALSGNVRCFVNDELFIVNRGDVFFFHPHTLHRTVTTGEGVYKRYVISFREEWITGFIPAFAELLDEFQGPHGSGNVVVHLDEGQLGELLGMVAVAQRCGEEDACYREMRLRMAYAELLLHLCSLFQSAESAPAPACDANLKKAEAVARYIRDNLESDLSLDRLSAQFYLAKSYLCRLFRQRTGYSVNEYVVSVRIHKARRMLSDGCSVMQACERSGFGDYAHFIRTFSRLVGVSPKQYAKRVNLSGGSWVSRRSG